MLIAHLSLTYFLLPVSRRFPSAAHLLSLIEGPRLELERFSSKLSGSGSAGAARRRTSVRRARRAPRRARSTTRKSALSAETGPIDDEEKCSRDRSVLWERAGTRGRPRTLDGARPLRTGRLLRAFASRRRPCATAANRKRA